MTISYTAGFAKLLMRWKGSLWKSIARYLFIYLILYYIINAIYRFVLDAKQQKDFQNVIILFHDFTRQYPLTFLLGFYVAMVIRRWWQQFNYISYPDEFLFYISAFIRGSDVADVRLRRLIARYTVLAAVTSWRNLSPCVLKRFPTMQHVVDAKLMTREELIVYNAVKVEQDPYNQWFVPINWIQTLLVKCYENGRLTHTNELKFLLEHLHQYRANFLALLNYDWICIPLVYTQVATIATFGYFALCLIGHQVPAPIEYVSTPVDIYIPIYTILQFLFYIGWLKVGEDLMHPFGEDDEDFELNYILDRHSEMAYLIVDQLHMEAPDNALSVVNNNYSKSDKQLNDQSCDWIEPSNIHLPHTKASIKILQNKPTSHIASTEIPTSEMEVVNDIVEYDVPKQLFKKRGT